MILFNVMYNTCNALKPQGMHLPCNMVLLVFTDATVSTAPVLFSGKASSSGIPSKYNVHEIECMTFVH